MSDAGPAERRVSWRQVVGRLAGQPLVFVGAVLVAATLAVGVLGPLLAPYGPDVEHFSAALQGPSAAHWLGTDELGRDVLSRLLYGAAPTLGSGALIVLLALAIGVPLGLVSGYLGGVVDEVVMRLVDAALAFPGLVLALAVAWILGPSLVNAVLAVGAVTVPQFTRVARGQAVALRKREYVEAARSFGGSARHILIRHVLPNAATPIVVLATLNLGTAILAVASLSFLGLGPPPPAPNWGAMAQEGAQYLSDAPWISLFPGAAILLAALGFNLVGDALRDLLDPKARTLPGAVAASPVARPDSE